MVIVNRAFFVEVQTVLGQMTAELVAFCAKKKIDHRTLPALQELGRAIRILQEIE